MAEQMVTPGSNADTSVKEGKSGAPKDKACPFCQQTFTSSSLGRHLDLYIKERNPKPADGLHDVIEIQKLRGGITRRQPRTSMSRRDDSTPAGTPRAMDRRSPRPESDRQGNRSPSLRRDEYGAEAGAYKGKPNYHFNKGTWESTGVMNIIPPTKSSDARSWDGDDRGEGRRSDGRGRSVSKQMLAKTTFEQKQKMIDALDNAKAAELALRELLGSLRAAKQHADGPAIFDYDPFSLTFPALTLHCLPPPPTLQQSTTVPTTKSWSLLPPNEPQYQALRAHFSNTFHRWRVSCAIATTVPRDDLSYPPTNIFGNEDPSELAERAEVEASELEIKIAEHLHSVFTHWISLPAPKRMEIWTLELARGVGRKSNEVERLKKEKELAEQESAHLRQQVDDLSRLQHPREFKIVPPSTLPISSGVLHRLGELGLGGTQGVGFNLMDRHFQLDTVIERAIGRWKNVVRDARGGPVSGLSRQRNFSGDSSVHAPATNTNTGTTPVIQTHPPEDSSPRNGMEGVISDQDADADADADMEEDDSFVNMTEAPQQQHSGAPEAHVSTSAAPAGANYRLGNGTGGRGNEGVQRGGMENQVVPGYVSIPAR